MDGNGQLKNRTMNLDKMPNTADPADAHLLARRHILAVADDPTNRGQVAKYADVGHEADGERLWGFGFFQQTSPARRLARSTNKSKSLSWMPLAKVKPMGSQVRKSSSGMSSSSGSIWSRSGFEFIANLIAPLSEPLQTSGLQQIRPSFTQATPTSPLMRVTR
jgi:hypothetical protein